MKKIIFFNLTTVIIIVLIFEVLLRTLFNLNVQGISKNLINNELDFTFNNPNIKGGVAFGAPVYTDKYGYRISKDINDKEYKKEILFVGGSVTFGPAVEANKTFVELLNSSSNFKIKNASVFGSNIENHFNILKNVDLSNVEKIFISFSLDDISNPKIILDEQIKSEKNLKEKIKSIPILNKLLLFLRSNSAIYVLAKNIILDNQNNYYLYDLNLYKNQSLVNNIDKNLLKIANEFKNKNIYFYIIPYAAQVNQINCSKKDFAEEIIISKIKKHNFKLIDLKKNFCSSKNTRDLYLKFDPAHLSSEGHLLVFRTLKNYLD